MRIMPALRRKDEATLSETHKKLKYSGEVGIVKLPLNGVKILDLSTMYPGPLCTMLLADYGAEVIRIEPPKGGDLWRLSQPRLNGLGMPYLQVNRNKKSMTLNLKEPEAKEIFYDLVRTADVVVEQYRPGVVKRLGIDYETVKQYNEKLVYCSISGYGQDGPYRLKAGHDINYISQAGILGLTARKGEKPVIPGVQIGDIGGGALYAVIGILIALMGARETGRGQYVDTAMFDGAISLMAWPACGTLVGSKGLEPEGSILIGQLACYNVYETKDGRYMSLGAVENHLWGNFCEFVGHPEYTALQRDEEKQPEMKAEISRIFKERTLAEWVEALAGVDCCWSAVNTVDEAMEDPQVTSRGMIIEITDPQGEYGTVKMIGDPIKLSDTPARKELFPPRKGEHTKETLLSIGRSEEEIADLRARGVI